MGTTLTRVPNWNVALGELAQDVIGQPFKWGETDCVSVFRKALVAMYGEDIATPYINVTYTTKAGATRAFNKIGSYIDIILAIGGREISVNLARDGDILVFPKGESKFENVMTKMGGSWVLSDPIMKTVVPARIYPTSFGPEVKVFRIV